MTPQQQYAQLRDRQLRGDNTVKDQIFQLEKQLNIDPQDFQAQQRAYQAGGGGDKAILGAEGGAPARPEFRSILTPGGELPDKYKYDLGGQTTSDYATDLMAKHQGLQGIKDVAFADPGQSQWEQYALQKQKAEEATARDEAQKRAATSGAEAWNQLAMRGGAGQGARERIATGAARSGMMNLQNVSRQGQMARAGIGQNAEDMRMGMLKLLPGAEMQQTEGLTRAFDTTRSRQERARQQNVNQALGQLEKQRLYNLGSYEEAQKKYAAEQDAKAIANQDTGCWICTKVNEVHPLSATDKEALFEFKKYVLKNHRGGARFYLRDCKELVARMDKAGVDWKDMVGFDNAVITLIKANQPEAAYILYRDTTVGLIQEYWPDCESKAYMKVLSEKLEETETNPFKGFEKPELKEEDQDLLEKVLPQD